MINKMVSLWRKQIHKPNDAIKRAAIKGGRGLMASWLNGVVGVDQASC